MAVTAVTVQLRDVGLVDAPGVACRLSLVDQHLPAITADTLVDPTTSDSAPTDTNGQATLSVNATDDYIHADGLASGIYTLTNGAGIQAQVVVPRAPGPYTARSLIQAGVGRFRIPATGQFGWIWSQIAPANPLPGLGWARTIGNHVELSVWNGASWVSQVVQGGGGGGGGGLLAVATAEPITGDGTALNPVTLDIDAIDTSIRQRALRSYFSISPDTFSDSPSDLAFTVAFTIATQLDSLWTSAGNDNVQLLFGTQQATVTAPSLVRTSAAQVTYMFPATLTASEAAIVRSDNPSGTVPVSLQLRQGAATLHTLDTTIRVAEIPVVLGSLATAEASSQRLQLRDNRVIQVIREQEGSDPPTYRTRSLATEDDIDAAQNARTRIGVRIAALEPPAGTADGQRPVAVVRSGEASVAWDTANEYQIHRATLLA